MDEKKVYDTIEAALYGLKHIEATIDNLTETKHETDLDVLEALETIYKTNDTLETLLYNLFEIHNEEEKTAARLDAITEAESLLSHIIAPEDNYVNIPEGVKEDLPFNEVTTAEERNRAAYYRARQARINQRIFNP